MIGRELGHSSSKVANQLWESVTHVTVGWQNPYHGELRTWFSGTVVPIVLI